MRKKDYELIASVFSDYLNYGDFDPQDLDNTEAIEYEQTKNLAEGMARTLASAYSKFDRQKFLTACGIEVVDTCKHCGMDFQGFRDLLDHIGTIHS